MSDVMDQMAAAKEAMRALYGENKPITDGNYDKALSVRCINGTFVGKENDGIIEFKGIPFVGRQPVGELRWKAPVAYAPDNGVYEAYYNGKTPCQMDGDAASPYVQGEDCLYLNVWTASDKSAAKKPVIVWIYGGAFETGGSIAYNYLNFIKENPDVVTVVLSYRLGVLGFFHLSHLSDGKDYPDAQNLGLLDQLMGLKWVHENIAGFGGDPDNVTIQGESAGAGSCTLLPLVEGSQAYFKRVIAHSGAPGQTRTPEQAIKCTDQIMDALGCKTVADLMKISATELIDTAGKLIGLYSTLAIRTFPERDGKILPTETYDAYANGAAKNIDFLHGCNKDEMNAFLAVFGPEFFNEWGKQRMEEKLAQLTDEEKALVESYFQDVKGKGVDGEDYSRLFSQIMFNAPQIRLSEVQTKAGGKSYTYYFTPEASAPVIKSGHGIEVSTIFNDPKEVTDTLGVTFDGTFGKIFRKMLVQFAKTGNPSLSADISPDGKAYEWPLYDLEDKKVMVLDEFDIHPEKESERKIVDWDRTYFLTKYYMP